MHIKGRAVLVWILRRSCSHSRLEPRSRFSKSRLRSIFFLQLCNTYHHYYTFSRCNTRCHFLGLTYVLVTRLDSRSTSDPVGQLGPLTRLFVGRCRKIWRRPTVTIVYNKADRRLAGGGGGGLYQKHVRHRPRGKWAVYLRDHLQSFSILFTFHVRFVRELLIFIFFGNYHFLNLEDNFPSKKNKTQ